MFYNDWYSHLFSHAATSAPVTSGPGTTAAPTVAPTVASTVSNFPEESSADMKVVCYYPNWPYYRPGDGKYLVEDIPTSLCTHIIYSFVVLDPNTHLIKIHDDWLDVQLGNIEKFTALKTSNPGVKFMIALGGWTDSRILGTLYGLILLLI